MFSGGSRYWICRNLPIKYNLEEDYSYKQGMQKGIELGEKQTIKKAIIAMLMLGNKPEDIAEYLEVPMVLVIEIQQELN